VRPSLSVPSLPSAVRSRPRSGFIYAAYALDPSHRMQVVAVAEPRALRREQFARQFRVPAGGCVADWRDLLAAPGRVADAVLVCVQDRLHAEVAVAFAARGYHILLEKPMAVSLADCLAIHAAVEAHGVMLAVGHVLRYTALNRAIRAALDGGRVGRVVAVQHLEPIGFFHYAHSYVRGNWRREDEATFALMAKSCHDLDLLAYWLQAPAARVSSTGALHHFRRDRKPEAAGAAVRCDSCPIERACPYSAVKIYLEPTQRGHRGWPVDVITDVAGPSSSLSPTPHAQHAAGYHHPEALTPGGRRRGPCGRGAADRPVRTVCVRVRQ
jgi:predicted dehydrogenase